MTLSPTLSPDDRKAKLGLGGLARIARRVHLTMGHVSQVNRELRRDAKVERAITREIVKRNPGIDPATIWPADRAESVAA